MMKEMDSLEGDGSSQKDEMTKEVDSLEGDIFNASHDGSFLGVDDVGNNDPQEESAGMDGSVQEDLLSKGIAHVRKKLRTNIHDDAVKEALLVSKHKLYYVKQMV